MNADDVYLTFQPTGYLDHFEPGETDYFHEFMDGLHLCHKLLYHQQVRRMA